MSGIRSTWSTAAGRMKLLFTAICVASAAYTAIVYSTVSAEHATVQAIGREGAPSVFIAGRITLTAAESAKAAANAFQPGQMVTPPDPNVTYCDQRRSSALVSAATRELFEQTCKLSKLIGQGYSNITVSETVVLPDGRRVNERETLDRISVELTEFNRMVQAAYDNRLQLFPVDLSYLRRGAEAIERIEAAAKDLVDVNDFVLNRQYEARETSSKIHLAGMLASGIVLLLLTWYLNRYMAGIFRRRFSGPILLAQAIILLSSAYAAFALITVDLTIAHAKEGPYQRSYQTYATLSNVTMMHTTQSIYLLKRGGDKDYEARLAQLTTRVAGAGNQGEDVARWFRSYNSVNQKIRELVAAGQQEAAVELALGGAEGQSVWAYRGLQDSLNRELAVNQQQFETAVNRGFALLTWLDTGALAVMLLCAGLVFGGLRSRLALLKL